MVVMEICGRPHWGVLVGGCKTVCIREKGHSGEHGNLFHGWVDPPPRTNAVVAYHVEHNGAPISQLASTTQPYVLKGSVSLEAAVAERPIATLAVRVPAGVNALPAGLRRDHHRLPGAALPRLGRAPRVPLGVLAARRRGVHARGRLQGRGLAGLLGRQQPAAPGVQAGVVRGAVRRRPRVGALDRRRAARHPRHGDRSDVHDRGLRAHGGQQHGGPLHLARERGQQVAAPERGWRRFGFASTDKPSTRRPARLRRTPGTMLPSCGTRFASACGWTG